MKNTKKRLLGLVLALSMALSLGSVSLAADTQATASDQVPASTVQPAEFDLFGLWGRILDRWSWIWGGKTQTVELASTEVAGVDYYYAETSAKRVKFHVTWADGETDTLSARQMERISGTNLYYVADEDQAALEGTLYGTADMPFADFYYGELGNRSNTKTTPARAQRQKKNATLQRYESEGYYDAVSSATNSKWQGYATTYTSEANEDGSGSILGLNDVPVAVDAELYTQLMVMDAAGKTTSNGVIALAKSIENLSGEAVPVYKTLYADGTYSAYNMETQALDATASITTDTRWGNYLVTVSGLPGTINGKSNVQTVILTTSDGRRYALQQGNNLFFKTGEMSWAVNDGFVEPHGNTIKYKAHQSLEGKTITNITYVVNGDYEISSKNEAGETVVTDSGTTCQKFSLDVELYCPLLVEAGTVSATLDGSVATVDLSKLPEDYAASAPVVKSGSGRQAKTLVDGTDYTWDAESSTVTFLTALDDETTYSFTFSDTSGKYGIVSATVTSGVSAVAETTEIAGVSYHYADLSQQSTARVTWADGSTATLVAADMAQVPGTSLYYTADKAAEALAGTLYGTTNMTFADFYYGELGNASDEDATVADALTGEKNATLERYGSEGYYDAVSSATDSKWKNFPTTYISENEDGTGSILGLKDVPVAVDADLYVQLMVLNAAGESTSNGVLDLAKSIELTGETGTVYKTLYADGTYSAYCNMPVEKLTDASASITTSPSTPWGHYAITLTGLPEDATSDTIQTILLTTSDGDTYALQQGNNTFFPKPAELAFAVQAGFVEPHGNSIKYKAYENMTGKDIVNITYVLTDKKYSLDVNLHCAILVQDGLLTATLNDNTATIDSTKLPVGYQLSAPVVKDSSGRHGTVLVEGTDYTWDAEAQTVTFTSLTSEMTYTFTFSDKSGKYGAVSTSVTAPVMETEEPSVDEETPTEPEPEVPAEPATPEAPTEPEPEAPAQPEDEAPADPAPEAPSTPEADASGDAEPETPAEPEADLPAEA